MKVFWSPSATSKLDEIFAYIERDKPLAARKWLLGLRRHVDAIAPFPQRGRAVPEMGRVDLREIIYGNYRIIYRIFPRRIEIVSIHPVRQLLQT